MAMRHAASASANTTICRCYLRRLVVLSIAILQLCWIFSTNRSLSQQYDLQEGYSEAGAVESLKSLPHNNDHTTATATISQGQTTTRQTIPVFYNLYVNPDNEDDFPRVQKLVTEQLAMLRPEQHWPIYIKSIGRTMNIPNTTLLGHYQKGSEMLTLHALWEYCHNHTDQSVVYLHSKGSFHDRPENDLLRNFMTRGAVECSQYNNNDDDNSHHLPPSCNVCSSRFAPYPHPHTSGNMFMSHCDYVTKLINPLHFAHRMEDVPRAPGLKKRFEYYLVGRQRFAAEHWIYSHPTVEPCDVYRGNFSCGYDNIPQQIDVDKDFDMQTAPRFPWKFYRPREDLKPWTGLKHRIKEYEVLYNAGPAGDWWGWRIDEWRQERDNITLNADSATAYYVK